LEIQLSNTHNHAGISTTLAAGKGQ
jgi:hypothetical protein